MPRQPKEDPASIYTETICKEWIQNPLQNPLVKKKHTLKVNETGVYGKLKKNCKKLYNLSPTDEAMKNDDRSQRKITREQCKELEKNPLRSPLTGRKMNPNVLHGIYQQLVNECQALTIELNDVKKQIPEENQLTSLQKDRLYKIRLRNAIRVAIKPILYAKDSLENRVHVAKVIRKYLETIQPCVKVSTQDKQLLVLTDKSVENKITEKIYFKKRIGSASVYGTAYMNVGKGLAKLLRFSAKIMPHQFKQETEHLAKMTQLVEEEKTPNMPITYKTLSCITIPPKYKIALTQQSNNTNIIKKGRYYVVLNELADGDLHDFFKNKYRGAVYESVILQTLLSLRAFHKYIKHIHNDAHLGNFLYHKITPGGYWHYTYNGRDIYIPNEGYLVVLWDPGMALPINRTNNPVIDYYRVLSLISGINSIPDYQTKGMLPVLSGTLTPFKHILNTIQYYPYPEVVMRWIIDSGPRFFKYILFQKPMGSFIINTKPYDLSP